MPQNVPLTAHEEPPQGGEARQLQTEETRGEDVKADEAEVEELEEVVQDSEHQCHSEGGERWEESEKEGEVVGEEVAIKQLPEPED